MPGTAPGRRWRISSICNSPRSAWQRWTRSRLGPARFRFEQRDYLADVLRSAGYARIVIEPFDAEVSSGNVDAMTAVLTKVGPLGKILREAPLLRARAESKVRAALAAKAVAGVVHLTAAAWIVTAAR